MLTTFRLQTSHSLNLLLNKHRNIFVQPISATHLVDARLCFFLSLPFFLFFIIIFSLTFRLIPFCFLPRYRQLSPAPFERSFDTRSAFCALYHFVFSSSLSYVVSSSSSRVLLLLVLQSASCLSACFVMETVTSERIIVSKLCRVFFDDDHHRRWKKDAYLVFGNRHLFRTLLLLSF